MTILAHLIPPLVPHVSYGGICPCCSGVAYRVQRRPFDHFINFFLPVYRYRCGSLGCNWEGNLLVQREPPFK